jgi:hypothetical protein
MTFKFSTGGKIVAGEEEEDESLTSVTSARVVAVTAAVISGEDVEDDPVSSSDSKSISSELATSLMNTAPMASHSESTQSLDKAQKSSSSSSSSLSQPRSSSPSAESYGVLSSSLTIDFVS